MDISLRRSQRRTAGSLLQGGERGGQGVENPGAQGHVMVLAFAANADEACSFEFLDVVRERGGGDGQGGAGLRAAQRTCGFGDVLKEFEAARIGERLEERGAASTGDADGPGAGWLRVFYDGCGHGMNPTHSMIRQGSSTYPSRSAPKPQICHPERRSPRRPKSKDLQLLLDIHPVGCTS